MQEITELLEQKEYDTLLWKLIEILKESPKLLNELYDLKLEFDYTKKEQEMIDALKKILRTKQKEIVKFAMDITYQTLREERTFYELFQAIRKKLAKEHKKKAMELQENNWTKIELELSTKFPKVELQLTFNAEELKIQATVEDKHFLDGNRSWRYGDGFYINFAMLEEDEKEECVDTNRFYSFGFSLEDGKPVGVLVNKHGDYFLSKNEELTPEITIDKEKMTAEYKITIPFKFLIGFDPLIDEISGINIVYTSQKKDGAKEVVHLIEDYNRDSEITNYRKFAPVTYHFSEKEDLKIAAVFPSRLISENKIETKIHLFSPKKVKEKLTIQIIASSGDILKEVQEEISIENGKNILTKEIDLENYVSDIYTVRLSFQEKIWEQTFFKYSPMRIQEMREEIHSLSRIGETVLLENSIHSLHYRLDKLEEQINQFHPRDDPSEIRAKFLEIDSLINECKKNTSIFKRSGYLLAAFKSPQDDSLQPYSFVFPEKFDTKNEYHLLVALHGSGVTEVGYVSNLKEKMGKIPFIVVAPRGRNLSDGYTGQTEKDVVALIGLVKEMFKTKKTLILGFSMGGYGVWRMTFKHPELFDGAIVIAGNPSFGQEKENDMSNYLGKSKEINYLVIHGIKDRAVPIDETDEFVKLLKSKDYTIQYERVEGKGHGDLQPESIIQEWLQKYYIKLPKEKEEIGKE